MSIKKLGDLAQRLEVLDDLIANVRPLHLDYDRATIAHVGAMHLGQGSGG